MPSQPQRNRKKSPPSPFGSTSAIGEEISGDESVGRSRCQRGIRGMRRSGAHGGPAGEERRLKVGARVRVSKCLNILGHFGLQILGCLV
ncbi:hypothetical protein ERO13_A10G073200v2 [Gossypium hirsutum]|uniref:Uncharacterized protein n=2 Tax=Gossypium TaxID=3633 RepID=A0A5D2NMM3_GOSTO|nr:hypothetical protein ERO13_A10G073200v2 [Gossypium hirsutum]TYG98022.1 hypothetical protein ES288_A10G084600v1 [Gossypium darwinii]TYI05378.1 hypothetical protein ES332_A10G084000v1 [Gossypium tomentosum]